MNQPTQIQRQAPVVAKMMTVRDVISSGKAEALVSDIKKRIAEAFVYRGITAVGSDLDVMARMYAEDLRREFAGIDICEINDIIRYGVRGRFGEYFGINAGTLYDWTERYISSPERDEYLARKRRMNPAPKQLSQKTELSQAEIDAGIAESVNSHYRDYVRMMSGGKVDAECQAGNFLDAAVKAKSMGGSIGKMRYPFGHPLCDIGNYMSDWLHDHGFRGTLKEIFEQAMANGQEYAVQL